MSYKPTNLLFMKLTGTSILNYTPCPEKTVPPKHVQMTL